MSEDAIIQYGRRGTDLLPGVLVREDGRYYIRAAQLNGLHNQLARLSQLMDVARSIMAEISLDTLLGQIIEKVTEVMSADRSTLFILDSQNAQLWSRVAQGGAEIRIPLGAGIAGDVAASGVTANIPDAYADPRFNAEFDRKSGYLTKSILCMAIKNPRAETIGVIQVLNKKDGSPFSSTDEELLSAFCSLAGISLENARAYDELAKEKDSLEIKVQDRTKDLALEKRKSDDLLLNILPEQVATELKTKGRAEPKRFDLATVLFTDFKGFTSAAEKLDPAALIEELDKCFFYFDEVAVRFGLEKIKTIGDSYMCAGGLPKPNQTNPVDAILAALEINNFMLQMREIKIALNEPFWEIRIGVHSGPVIAGVVGKFKFAYDIWGDTVNTASRMESSGSVGKVNISEVTYALVKDFFTCAYRGKVEAKSKGEISMYFVEGIKPELSIGGQGTVPNDAFRAMLAQL
ncbi:MAG: GAF domain-containing protein [Leptospirales bacterium]|nr:GAF domain-containing protein [Leptospirales bacterium]